MPIHDWTRVLHGEFHAFHNYWIGILQDVLNNGILPESYYALGDQRSGEIGPDVLTLQESFDDDEPSAAISTGDRGVSVAEAPPKVSIVSELDEEVAFYQRKQRALAIRHTTDDRLVAIVEILSPANKHNRRSIRQFVDKVISAFEHGVHLLLVDLFPPSNFDPNGIHGLLWEDVDNDTFEQPPDRPMTLAAYRAGLRPTAYVEPIAVGNNLIDMPLFLTFDHYVNVPLQATYDRTYQSMPPRTKRLLETPPTDD
jgi:hypothetical protein